MVRRERQWNELYNLLLMDLMKERDVASIFAAFGSRPIMSVGEIQKYITFLFLMMSLGYFFIFIKILQKHPHNLNRTVWYECH